MKRFQNLAIAVILAVVTLAAIILRRIYLPDKEQNKALSNTYKISGTAMGSPYSITYVDSAGRNLKPAVDSLLNEFNASLSGYDSASEISILNKEKKLKIRSRFFLPALRASKELYRETNAAFNPAVKPLIELWGFGVRSHQNPPSSAQIDSAKILCDFEKVFFSDSAVWFDDGVVSISFNALAPGLASDLVAEKLKSRGVKNFVVELGGGEVVCAGAKENGKPWRIGLKNPLYKQDGKTVKAVAELNDQALATSGNYERFYVKNGKKYSHTIDPKTGRPVDHNLLSACVFAQNCARADGLATAFMVMGLKKSRAFLKGKPGLEAYLIYEEDGKLKTYISPGLKDIIRETD